MESLADVLRLIDTLFNEHMGVAHLWVESRYGDGVDSAFVCTIHLGDPMAFVDHSAVFILPEHCQRGHNQENDERDKFSFHFAFPLLGIQEIL